MMYGRTYGVSRSSLEKTYDVWHGRMYGVWRVREGCGVKQGNII